MDVLCCHKSEIKLHRKCFQDPEGEVKVLTLRGVNATTVWILRSKLNIEKHCKFKNTEAFTFISSPFITDKLFSMVLFLYVFLTCRSQVKMNSRLIRIISFNGKSWCYLLDFVGKLLRGFSILPGDWWEPAVVKRRKRQNRNIALITSGKKETL